MTFNSKLYFNRIRNQILISEARFDDENPLGPPNKDITSKFANRIDHPYKDIDILHKKGKDNKTTIQRLGDEEYKDVTKDASVHDLNNIPQLSNEMAQIMKIESEHKTQLEFLVKSTIQKYFGIPREVIDTFEIVLVNSGIKWDKNAGNRMDENEDMNVNDLLGQFNDDEKAIIKAHVNKRIVANALMMGAGYRAHNLIGKIKPELDEIDKRLYPFYIKLMSLHAFQSWKIAPTNKIDFHENRILTEEHRMLAGRCFLKLGPDVNGDGIRDVLGGRAEAIIFPVLLHEAIKVVIEYLFANGLPQFTKPINKAVINQADQLHFEHWHKLLGPRLWKHLHDAIDYIVKNRDTDYTIVAYLLQEISMLPPAKFLRLFDMLLHDGENAIAWLTNIVDGIEEDLNNPVAPPEPPEAVDFDNMEDILRQFKGVLQQQPPENVDDLVNHKPFNKMTLLELNNFVKMAIEKGEFELAAEAVDEIEKRNN